MHIYNGLLLVVKYKMINLLLYIAVYVTLGRSHFFMMKKSDYNDEENVVVHQMCTGKNDAILAIDGLKPC